MARFLVRTGPPRRLLGAKVPHGPIVRYCRRKGIPPPPYIETADVGMTEPVLTLEDKGWQNALQRETQTLRPDPAVGTIRQMFNYNQRRNRARTTEGIPMNSIVSL